MTESIKTAIRDLEIDQGSTYRQNFVWKTGTPKVPRSLVGCTARMQVRSNVGSTVVLCDLSTANGKIILNAIPGGIDLMIPAAETSAFSFESAVYDLEIIFADGEVVRLMKGTVTLSKEVTR
jgi:hypothetical protein